ncbi:hypothetical protein GXP67_00700 [Rhodocytophaga rosea]|uniref:Uncharacterized protein n=1 Tax=Rhodocytophaga rosea TaxID=2704465 RepID=A0A6C0GBS1_9BACT|nr:hypothetical protein [Rhodocytophaga rosea]QHT65294.1 hypothetical protein GXP67_00700 [Rhodocytophaga rosea]
MEKLAYIHTRIQALKSEIYILLIDDLFLEYTVAEKIIEDNFLMIGGNRNPDTIKKINLKFREIKELQSLLGT